MTIKQLLKGAYYPIVSLLNSNLLQCKIVNKIKNSNNNITIKNYSKLKNVRFTQQGNNNHITIGSHCNIKGLKILMLGNNNKIIIGNNVFINGSKYQPVTINACEGKTIYIGNECIFSNNIEIHTTDYHSILDNEYNRINDAKDVYIGNHCWIGLRSIILKGSFISDNTIVGAGTLVSGKTLSQSNCIITGVPAKIIKDNTHWDIHLI